MDFKGHFSLSSGGLCYPFTSLDDHSRYSIILEACPNQRRLTVQDHLVAAFRRYGLPTKILADNGVPWSGMIPGDITGLEIWLIRLGIQLIHGRPFHPQTQGKEERFHRTLQDEVLSRRSTWDDLEQLQSAFSSWRDIYNHQRPHESLEMDVPAKRYTPSSRAFPERLPSIEYDAGLDVRKVQARGVISFKNRKFKVGKALEGFYVALKPTDRDGLYDVYLLKQRILQVDMHGDKRAIRLTKKV